MQVSLSTQKFAGRLRHFIPAWMSLTADENILDTVQHCHLEIGNPDQPRPRPEIQFNPEEKAIINAEITYLLKLGVIEPAVHCPNEYISSIFVRKKKSGKYRMILNLKGLNKYVEKHHFKMDTLWSAVRLMTPNCFMASLDLTLFPLQRNTVNISGFTGRVFFTNTHACQMDFHLLLGFLQSY